MHFLVRHHGNSLCAEHLHGQVPGKEEETPLAKHLKTLIRVRRLLLLHSLVFLALLKIDLRSSDTSVEW